MADLKERKETKKAHKKRNFNDAFGASASSRASFRDEAEAHVFWFVSVKEENYKNADIIAS